LQGNPYSRAPTGRQIRGAESPRKVLQVLLRFTQDRPHATISELASEIGVPLSTCYRYVGLLREVGLLEEGERATYHVTPQIMHVARAAQVSNDLTRIARQFMQEVAAAVNETVMLMQAYGWSAVCIESIESTRPVRLAFESGHTLPLGDGASGKLLLAYMSDQERTARLDERAAADPEFASRREALEKDLQQLAEQGWATSLAEVEEGVWACAAAIRNGDSVPGVLTAAGPAFRIHEKSRAEIRDRLLQATAGVSKSLSVYRQPEWTQR
jgi:DNA-binding IclR family transcriptional regulator